MNLKYFSAFIKKFTLEYIATIIEIKIFDIKFLTNFFIKKMSVQLNIAENGN